jgi:hypothetical protein
LSESPTKSDEKQLSTGDVTTPAECELGNGLNSSVVSAIMADVATALTVVAGGDDDGSTSSSQYSGNRQEIKDSNEQVSSHSGLVLPVSQEGGEKGGEKPRSSAGCDGKAPRGTRSRKRKRKEMEGGQKKWVSRREAEPKRKKVI